MQLAPEVEVSLAGYQANLKAAIDANDLNSQALALDRIGALYFTHGDPAEALKHFERAALHRARTRRADRRGHGAV